MIPALQKLIIIGLALLQMAAPLVHAHAGAESSGLGVHVPGLESLSIRIDNDGVSSISGRFQIEMSTVSIASAIPQKNPLPVFENSAAWVVVDFTEVFSVAADGRLINFSPQIATSAASPPPRQHPTRAPPSSSR